MTVATSFSQGLNSHRRKRVGGFLKGRAVQNQVGSVRLRQANLGLGVACDRNHEVPKLSWRLLLMHLGGNGSRFPGVHVIRPQVHAIGRNRQGHIKPGIYKQPGKLAF